ncbi:MAG: TonB family protein [Bacteroidetes bacterium]|jgi:protein TonB|nr:TonB family protein [Bacteroidota bacterium]
MQTKKTEQANLENKKSLFFEAGLIIALALTLFAFEWGTKSVNDYYLTGTTIDEYETDYLPPNTDFERPKITPPPPVITEFEIVESVDEHFIDEMPDWNVEDNPYSYKPFEAFGKDEEVAEVLPFRLVQKTPSFNGGGLDKFQEYLYKNMRYPEVAQRNGISGKVIAQFVVNEQGKVVSVMILRSIDESLSKEVVRVLTGSPKWTPGEQRGRKVKVQYNIPVFFTLNK